MNTILLVGLGNPGQKYKNNRHNVGFRIIEAIASAVASFSFKKMDSIVEISSFSHDGKNIILARPLLFMNLSGRAVRFLMDFYKISTSEIFVFHDDIDLEFARIKIKKGGGNGGHNGLKNIDNLIGNDYWRIRIGVGRPQEKSMVPSYVLSDFENDDEKIIEKILSNISENISLLFSDIKKFETIISDSANR